MTEDHSGLVSVGNEPFGPVKTVLLKASDFSGWFFFLMYKTFTKFEFLYIVVSA